MEKPRETVSKGTQTHQTHNEQQQAKSRAPIPTRRVPDSFGMYGYLTLGLVLCMLVYYFFGSPTLQLPAGQTSSTAALPQQFPPPLPPQHRSSPQDQPILKPLSKAQEQPVIMSTSERT